MYLYNATYLIHLFFAVAAVSIEILALFPLILGLRNLHFDLNHTFYDNFLTYPSTTTTSFGILIYLIYSVFVF